MKKSLLFILVIISSYVYGAEEMSFVTVISSPTGVARNVLAIADEDSPVPFQIGTLNFVTANTPFSGTGTISVEGSADLADVRLNRRATLESSQVAQWTITQGHISLRPDGHVAVKQAGEDAENPLQLDFMGDSSKNQRTYITVANKKDDNSSGKLRFQYSAGNSHNVQVPVLSVANKIWICPEEKMEEAFNIGGDDAGCTAWFAEDTSETSKLPPMEWVKCASQNSCGNLNVSGLAVGDYILAVDNRMAVADPQDPVRPGVIRP